MNTCIMGDNSTDGAEGNLQVENALEFNNELSNFVEKKNSVLITFELTAYPIFPRGDSKRNIVCFCLVWVIKRSENLYWYKP